MQKYVKSLQWSKTKIQYFHLKCSKIENMKCQEQETLNTNWLLERNQLGSLCLFLKILSHNIVISDAAAKRDGKFVSVLKSKHSFCFQYCAQMELLLHTLPIIPGETADPSAFIVSITSHSHFGRPKCLHVFVNTQCLYATH